ncbi:MAG TPA: VOC family protein [Firmicutes bacterium]|nr:VOC family protein [Bacillota bacterium]
MFKGIEHFGLMAKDPEKLARWYEEVLGFRTVFKIGNPPQIFIAGREKGMIEIIPWEKGVSEDKDKKAHIAIKVEDFEAAVNRLREAGVAVEEPRNIFANGKAAFFRDIENNVLHLVYRPEAVWSLD